MSRSPFWIRSVSPDLFADNPLPSLIKTLVHQCSGMMGELSAYYAQIQVGHIPHDIHAHNEEEILVLLSGELDCITDDSRYKMRAGSFSFHPSNSRHAFQSVGSEAATLFAFKRTGEKVHQPSQENQLLLFNLETLPPWNANTGIQRHRIFEQQPLDNGSYFSAEIIWIAPYIGYPVHQHDHDVMLILLQGEMSALGHKTSSLPLFIILRERLTPSFLNAPILSKC